MTEKRFTIIYNENAKMMQYVDNQKEEPNRWAIWNASETAQKLNELHEENIELKNSLKEFEVFESNRIKGGVVTNDDFSVTLHSNNEAYMVCNMINRFIRSVKNGSKD